MAKKTPESGPSPSEWPTLYTMTELEQVKVLSDPLRIRILEALCEGALTTKQLADRLGEKPTRLYHHVEALERVKLIRLTETRQNRGTVEKYYRAVARTFRADPGIFRAMSEGEDTTPLVKMVDTVLENTNQELRRLIDAGHDIFSGDEGIVSYLEVRAGDEEIDRLRKQLMAILRDLEKRCCEDSSAEGDRRYRLTLAYFPLDFDK